MSRMHQEEPLCVCRECVEAPCSLNITEEEYFDLAEFFSAFSDSSRLKLLASLLEGEKTVSELADEAGMSQSGCSHQLAKLRMIRLVKTKKDGKFTIYSLSDDHIRWIVRAALDHIRE